VRGVVYKYIYMFVSTYINECVHLLQTHTDAHAYMYIRTCICIYVQCMDMYMFMHAHGYIYMYTSPISARATLPPRACIFNRTSVCHTGAYSLADAFKFCPISEL